MSRTSTLFAGLFGSFAVSCFVMIMVPQSQLGGLQPTFTEEEGKFTDLYPIENPSVEQGRAIYAREGCISCHSQQIRDPQNGTDIERGWGPRRTVARDYIYENPPFLGSSRLGPDLTNVGAPEWRDEAKDDTRKPKHRDAAWQYLHLYAPKAIVTESNHPPYRYLFETRKTAGQTPDSALKLSGVHAPQAGFEVVPTSAAKSLVAYLLSLDRTHSLKEATAPGAAVAPAAAAPAAPAAK